MIVATDVHYLQTGAQAAAVAFEDWTASKATTTSVVMVDHVRDYVPGRFYERELPCLLDVLKSLNERPSVVIVDGYVHLDNDVRPGLGAKLFDALNGKVTIVGVAKNPYQNSPGIAVRRGQSRRPLYVTAQGMDIHEAADHVASMHGDSRLPTLLRLVDHLARGYEI